MLKEIISDRLSKHNGKAFQQLCWDILAFHFPNIQRPKMLQDFGSDGHCFEERKFFACYAPELKYENKETIKKITQDYEKFCLNWKPKSLFNQWIFLTNDDLIGGAHSKIADLNILDDGILKTNWGKQKIIELATGMTSEKIAEVFNLPLELVEEEAKKEDWGIISELYDYMKSQLTNSQNHSDRQSEGRFTKFSDKIKLNFDYQDSLNINRMLFENGIYEKTKIVADFLSLANQDDLLALRDKIQDDFCTICDTNNIYSKIQNYEKILEIVRLQIPTKYNNNPRYLSNSKALVMYFFEMCDFGLKLIDIVQETLNFE